MFPEGHSEDLALHKACFAAEMQMNKLAEALNIDPVELADEKYYPGRSGNTDRITSS